MTVLAETKAVGGEILELALDQAKIHGRIVLCGGEWFR